MSDNREYVLEFVLGNLRPCSRFDPQFSAAALSFKRSVLNRPRPDGDSLPMAHGPTARAAATTVSIARTGEVIRAGAVRVYTEHTTEASVMPRGATP